MELQGPFILGTLSGVDSTAVLIPSLSPGTRTVGEGEGLRLQATQSQLEIGLPAFHVAVVALLGSLMPVAQAGSQLSRSQH